MQIPVRYIKSEFEILITTNYWSSKKRYDDDMKRDIELDSWEESFND